MNRIILAICAITTIVFSSFGQAPEAFKYQAVIRDASGTILTNQAVGIQFTIIQGSIGGAAVYTETHASITNAYGLVNLEIGTGVVVSGDFTMIDWANNGPFYLETAVDATGGTSYTTMGTSQFLSVPYALYAKSSGPNGTLDQTMYHDGTEWVSTNNLSNNGTTVSTDADMQINGLTVGRGGGNINGNTANGRNALYSNTTGSSNTANGFQALYINTTGFSNTANGRSALFFNTTGNYNAANGTQALVSNTTGFSNTANGDGALFSNTTGFSNTALGYYANVASGNLSNATAIGANAEVDASNKIQLGDINVTSVATSGALTTGAVTYPNIDGTAGQLLTTDGLGTVSWTTFTGGGATGPSGAAGTTGAVGPTGPTGANGVDGATGPTGAAGPSGAAGTTGAVGPTGPTGIDGQGGVTIAGTNVAITGTGTTSDPYIVNSSYTEPIYTIGLWPELGGYVFRISSDGKHGLVAEIFDQGSTDLYEAQNMISNPSNHSTDGQIFMDWRMPTKYELNEMYLQKASIGFFAADEYWSSTEENSQTAWYQNFLNGNVGDGPMSNSGQIRSVREF